MSDPSGQPSRADAIAALGPLVLLLTVVVGAVVLCAIGQLPSDVTAALLGSAIGLPLLKR